MKKKAFVLTLFAVVALAVPGIISAAEVHPGVVVEVSHPDMGYRDPFLGFGVDLVVKGEKLEFKLDALYSATEKNTQDNLGQVFGEARLVAVAGRFRFGGGTTASYLRFNYLKSEHSAVRPFATAGIKATRDVTFYGTYVFPGKDDNWKVRRAELLTEAELGKHVRLDITTGYAWSDPRHPDKYDPACDLVGGSGALAIGRAVFHF